MRILGLRIQRISLGSGGLGKSGSGRARLSPCNGLPEQSREGHNFTPYIGKGTTSVVPQEHQAMPASAAEAGSSNLNTGWPECFDWTASRYPAKSSIWRNSVTKYVTRRHIRRAGFTAHRSGLKPQCLEPDGARVNSCPSRFARSEGCFRNQPPTRRGRLARAPQSLQLACTSGTLAPTLLALCPATVHNSYGCSVTYGWLPARIKGGTFAATEHPSSCTGNKWLQHPRRLGITRCSEPTGAADRLSTSPFQFEQPE